jgi:transposase
VICVDEKGPVAAKLYPPRGQWADARHRPHYQPDYGRRGYIWLFGALVPHTGEGLLYYGDRRDSRNFCAFMDRVARWAPEGDVHVVIDSLSIHTSVESLLWNFGHSRFIFHFLPKGAAWLNLIEGWWNILGHRALDGRDFSDTSELVAAWDQSLGRWNAAPTPFQWKPGKQRGRKRGKCIRCARLHIHHQSNAYAKLLGE